MQVKPLSIRRIGRARALPADAELTPMAVGSWPDVPAPVVGCMACQFERQVCGIEIVFA
jgi:hypothetical protein